MVDLDGLDAIFDTDNLLAVDDMDVIAEMDMDDEFLAGMETPLTSMAVFDDGPMLEPATKPAKDSMSCKDSAIKVISMLREQLRSKEAEIERLRVAAAEPTPQPRPDDFERIVEEAVAAVEDSLDDEWEGASLEPILPPAPIDVKAERGDYGDGAAVTPACAVPRARSVSPCHKRRVEALDLAAPKACGNKRPRKETPMLGRRVKSEPAGDADGDDTDSSPCSPYSHSEDTASEAGHVSGKNKKVARRWTPAQDEELRVAVAKHNGQNWKAIARLVTDRDHVQCLQRWKKVLQPGLVKGMWCKEEDDLLLKLMSNSQPKNWADIAAKVPGRTAKQCRERWSLNLDPSINRGAWTRDEDELLLKLHAKLGNRWAEIKRHLNGRTENGVKTRFKSIERARAKDKEVVWTPELEGQLHELAVRFECRIDEVAKHLPRALRGISSQAMRDHCKLLREGDNNSNNNNNKSAFIV